MVPEPSTILLSNFTTSWNSLGETYIICIRQRWQGVLKSPVAESQRTSLARSKGVSGDRKHIPTGYVKPVQ